MGWPVAFFLFPLRHAVDFHDWSGADEVDVTVCSFDRPATVTPADHIWVEDRLPWIRLADDLPSYEQKRQTHSA